MQPTSLEFLACPHCGGDLDLLGPEHDGRLDCRSGCGAYPIEAGVPRLLPELAGRDTAPPADLQDRTRGSFGAQWKMFRYGGTTWGTTEDQRVRIALHELGWQESDLAGKTILDAGCGNGTLSRALVDRGATVVAMDLSESVVRAEQNRGTDGLHFVQGNLFFPPLKRGVFDAIYSCGVFHHTPDTRRCFDALVPTLKEDADARYFVWLYARRGSLFNATVEPTMKLTRRLPSSLLVPTCKAMAPFVEISSRACQAAGLVEDVPRTVGDRAVQLHDLLSPRYVHYHNYDETASWARESGFQTIERARYTRPGDDVPTDLATILRDYHALSRPGFGLLCRDRQPAEAAVA